MNNSCEEDLEFTKQELYQVLAKCEEEAIKLTLAGKINLNLGQLKKTTKMLRRGIRIADEKSLSTLLILVRKEMDYLMHMAMLKRNARADAKRDGELDPQLASHLLTMFKNSMPAVKK